jgi:hypothetical protein
MPLSEKESCFVVAGELTLTPHVARDGCHRVIQRREIGRLHSGQPGVAAGVDNEQ